MRVQTVGEFALPMNLPSGSSRRQEAHSIPTRPPGKRSEPRYLGCYVSWVGSRPQCASGSWRSGLSMNLPSPGLAATLSHPMGEGLGVRALLRVGSWPQFACMSRWKVPITSSLVAADVRRPARSTKRTGSIYLYLGSAQDNLAEVRALFHVPERGGKLCKRKNLV